MLYRCKYESIILRQIEYDHRDNCFYFTNSDRIIMNSQDKITLCLEKQIITLQKLEIIKVLINNQTGWVFEYNFERIT